MKFDPTPKQLVLLAILFAAIIGAHKLAPTSVQLVTYMVSTLFGWAMGSPFKPTDAPPAPPANGGPQ